MRPTILIRLFDSLLRNSARGAAPVDGLRLPGGLFPQTRCARHINAMTRRVAAMGVKISSFSGRLHAGSIPGVVDADRSLRGMLSEWKQELSEMRLALAHWHARECHGQAGARLEAAITGLNRIAVETQAAAERLLSQIEEYDGARMPCLH